jgi:hypothetical protein
MLAVAACALLITAGLELAVWRPLRLARRELVAHHQRMKTYLDAELARSAYHMHSQGLVAEMTRSSAWHARRVRELSQKPGFDPDRERANDRTYQPGDEELKAQILMSKDAGERSF